MRYRLRTLLILMAIGPPLLAGVWFYDGPRDFWLIFNIAMLSVAFMVFLVATIRGACLALGPILRLFD